MIGRKQVFSTGKDDWATPEWLFQLLHARFEYTIDLAASKENAKLPRYFTEEDNSLKKSWDTERGFCNPPYSLAPEFIEKAYIENVQNWMRWGRDSSCAEHTSLLLPARTSNKEWGKYIFPHATELIFIEGRVVFEGASLGAPFPSVVVTFDYMGRPPDTSIKVSTIDARKYQAKIRENERDTFIRQALEVLPDVLN